MLSPVRLKLPKLNTKKNDSNLKIQSLSNSELIIQESIPLCEIKQQRKIIENDVKALAARLTNLRIKEAKIRKNVSDVQRKTFGIIEIKAKKELQLVKIDYYD